MKVKRLPPFVEWAVLLIVVTAATAHLWRKYEQLKDDEEIHRRTYLIAPSGGSNEN